MSLSGTYACYSCHRFGLGIRFRLYTIGCWLYSAASDLLALYFSPHRELTGGSHSILGRSLEPNHSARSTNSRQWLSEHRLRQDLRTYYKVLIDLGLVGAIAGWSFAIWRWHFTFANYGPAALWHWIRMPLGIGLLCALVATLGMIDLWNTKRTIIWINSAGVSFRKGRKRIDMLWPEIDQIRTRSIYYGPPGLIWKRRSIIDIEAVDGQRIRVDSTLNDFEELVAMIKQKIYPRLLSEYRQALSQRKSLSFGPIWLTFEGIRHKRKFLGWKNLGAVSLKHGILRIHPNTNGQEPQIRLPAYQIPNIDLCLQILQLLGHSS